LKPTVIYITLFLLVCNLANGQSKVIYGRVLSEDLEPVTFATIRADTSVAGHADKDGRFKISIPANTQTLSFGFVGMENTTINLSSDCDTVELIMMDNWHYDFLPLKKINKLRLKRFKRLPGLHLQAYRSKLFLKNDICYSMKFIPFNWAAIK
jgi:hypothetical protein